MEQKIGRVSATATDFSNTVYFKFWTDTNIVLDVMDVIKVEHKFKKSEEEFTSFTYGVIEEIEQMTDAENHMANYISSDYGKVDNNDPIMPRIGFNCVRARVLKNSKNVNTPCANGELVFKCDNNEITKILFGNKEADDIPFGWIEMYGKALKVGCRMKAAQVLGPDSVHVNISGVSGRGAKTTTAMNILSEIWEHDKNTAFLFFNVKGTDLMRIDRNGTLEEKKKESWESFKDAFKENKEPVGVFSNVTYYTPEGGNGESYAVTVKDAIDNINLLFSFDRDENYTLDTVTKYLQDNNRKSGNWEDILTELEDLPEDIVHKSVSQKARRIIKAATTNSKVFKDQGEYIDLKTVLSPGKVIVVDINPLDNYGRAFVMGSLLRQVKDLKNSDSESKPGKVIVFMDELNQFADRYESRTNPIKTLLVDIAARGRTDGIILFTAQQFLSKVDEQIPGNASVKLYGYLNNMELSAYEYNNMPPSYKKIIMGLKNGEMLLDSPMLDTPIKVHFPYPKYDYEGKTPI